MRPTSGVGPTQPLQSPVLVSANGPQRLGALTPNNWQRPKSFGFSLKDLIHVLMAGLSFTNTIIY